MLHRAIFSAPAQGLKMAAVGAAVNKRFLSHVFVRYIPKNAEMSELQKLADEYFKANEEVLKYGKVRLPMRVSKLGQPTGTKGSVLIDFDTKEEAENAQNLLQTSPEHLPSGRPAMVSQLSTSGLSLFLTPSPNDPFVLKFEKSPALVKELLSEFGTITEAKAIFSGLWPAGLYFCDYQEDDAAKKAVDALSGKQPAGLPYILELRVNLNPVQMGARRSPGRTTSPVNGGEYIKMD